MAAISWKRINKAALAERRTHRKTVLIVNILLGIATFLICVSENAGIGMGALVGFVAVMLSTNTVFQTFRSTSNQQLCDVAMSMPLSGWERFFSRTLCCFYIHTIPVSIASVISISAVIVRYYSTGGTAPFSGGTAPFSDVILLCTGVVLMVIAAALFMSAVSILSCSCCGTPAESTYLSVILIILSAALPYVLLTRMFHEPSGIDWFYNHHSVFSFFGFGFFFDLDSIEDNTFILLMLVNILSSLLIILLSGKIYVKRDARSVGTPIYSKAFFEIVMFLGVTLIYCGMFFSKAAGWGVFIAGIIYLILNIIICRKKITVSKFFVWAGKFAVITVVFVGIMSAAISSGGFGLINRQPEEILNGVECQVTVSSNNNFRGSHFAGEKLTDKQVREVLTIFQKYLDEGKLSPREVLFSDYTYDDFSICSITFRKSKNEDFGFEQELRIHTEQSQALIKELEKLPYFAPEEEDTELSEDEYYNSNVRAGQQ